jgi:hypothetical protein
MRFSGSGDTVPTGTPVGVITQGHDEMLCGEGFARLTFAVKSRALSLELSAECTLREGFSRLVRPVSEPVALILSYPRVFICRHDSKPTRIPQDHHSGRNLPSHTLP